jgi:drug/metabolite transporter (DMT)-like permease
MSPGAGTAPLVLAYAACALIWGTTWYAIRACIGGTDGYPTWEALALRFAIAGVLIIPFGLRARPWPKDRATWLWIVVAGVLDAAGYALVYLGEERVSGGLAAVLYGTQPLVIALLMRITGLDRVRRADVVGALVALVGVAALFADRIDVSWRQGAGVLLVLGSVIVSAVYSTIMKQRAAAVNAAATTTIFLAVTGIVLGAIVLVRGPAPVVWPPPPGPTFALIYLAAVGTVVAFVVYFWLLRRVSVMTTGTLVFVFPLIALAVDAAFERELPLEPRAYIGVALTLCGLAISLRSRARASSERARPA